MRKYIPHTRSAVRHWQPAGRPAESDPPEFDRPDRSRVALTLGVVSLLFAPLGVIAWAFASSCLRAIDEGRMDPAGESNARAGRVLGARGVSQWRHVMLPAAVPSFLGGMKQGWAFAWRSLLAGEIIVIVPGRESLGVLLQTGRDLSNSALLLAAMAVILLVGIVVDTVCFGRLEAYVRHRYGLDLA